MEQNEQKAIDDIEQYGCHILHVLEEDNLPGFSYSIGINKKAHEPDLVITGLKCDLSHWIINEYNQRIKNGESFVTDKLYDGFIKGFDVIFKKVLKENYDEYFGWGLWLHDGNEFDVYQMIYPSTDGVWPWDENAPNEYKHYIPALYE